MFSSHCSHCSLLPPGYPHLLFNVYFYMNNICKLPSFTCGLQYFLVQQMHKSCTQCKKYILYLETDVVIFSRLGFNTQTQTKHLPQLPEELVTTGVYHWTSVKNKIMSHFAHRKECCCNVKENVVTQRMNNRDVAMGLMFFSQTAVGIVGNFSLLY